jgi:hypothetical protein
MGKKMKVITHNFIIFHFQQIFSTFATKMKSQCEFFKGFFGINGPNLPDLEETKSEIARFR